MKNIGPFAGVAFALLSLVGCKTPLDEQKEKTAKAINDLINYHSDTEADYLRGNDTKPDFDVNKARKNFADLGEVMVKEIRKKCAEQYIQPELPEYTKDMLYNECIELNAKLQMLDYDRDYWTWRNSQER